MPDYIPKDWPDQKAKIPTGFLSKDQIMGPFTAMAQALGKLGQGISSLGKGLGGGGQQQGPDDEQLKEYATGVGESQVPGSLDPLGGPAPQGKDTGGISAPQPTVPQPTVSTTSTGEDIVNRGGGNPFHDDNALGEAQASNRTAVQQGQPPTPVPRPTPPTAPLAQGDAIGAQQAPPQQAPAIQAIFPPAPGSPYPSDQAGLFAGYGNKAKQMESWARSAGLAKITPGLETGILQDRLASAGDPTSFRGRVLSRVNDILKGDPDNHIPGVVDPVLQDGVRNTAAGFYQKNLRGMYEDMDAKTARDHFTGATDTIKSNTAKMENLAFQGGVWIDPKTGQVGYSDEVKKMILDNDTWRQSLVSDKRQGYPIATAQAERAAQGASILKEAVIGQVGRNFQKDWDRPSAEKALKEAFQGPGSERYNFTSAQRAAAINEGMTALDNFDTRNKAAIKENAEAATKMTDIWRSGKGQLDPMVYNQMIQNSRAIGDVDTANRLERERPLIHWSQSMVGASPAQRDQAQRELMHTSIMATGAGGKVLPGVGPMPVPAQAQPQVRDTYHQAVSKGFMPTPTKDAVSDMLSLVGRNEVRDHEVLTQWLKSGGSDLDPAQNAWCAAAVNAALAHAGIQGTTGDTRYLASSFTQWGQAVNPQQGLARGDVVVLPQGHSGLVSGMHVGFVSDPRVDGAGNVTIVAGNTANTMREYKVPVNSAMFRRAGSAEGGAPSPNSLMRAYNTPAAQQFAGLAQKYGRSPNDIAKMISIESSGNSRNQTGSYKGLLQLSDSEFNRYKARPDADIWNPQDNVEAGLRKMNAEGAEFETKAGRKASPFDIYMVHQRGLHGYLNAIKNPDSPAFSSMMGEGKGADWAKSTIYKNAPNGDFKDRDKADKWTNKEFIDAWRDKFNATTPGYSPETSPVFSANTHSLTFGSGARQSPQPSISAGGAAPPASSSSVPTAPTPSSGLPTPPADLYSQSPSGFAQAYAESVKIASEQASRTTGELEKLQEKGYPIHMDHIDRAAELAQYGGNREAHDKLETLHTALDIKNGIPPGTTHAQRSAAFEDAISNADNPHLAVAALQEKEALDAQQKHMMTDPLAWGAAAKATNQLGDPLANPATELSRRAVDIQRLQTKEPELGAISAIRPGEDQQVAKLLTTGDPKQAAQFLQTAQQTLGGPANATYRATMAAEPIKQALVAMAGNPDPARQGLAMGVLDGLFRQDPNGFRAAYGSTGVERLQMFQGLQGNFSPQQIAEKIANADDPAVARSRDILGKIAEKELGTAGGKLMDPQVVANKIAGGLLSGVPIVGSMIAGGGAPLDQLTANEMATQYSETYKGYRELSLSPDAAEKATLNSLKSRWAPSAVNSGRIMMFAPEAVSTPSNTKYYPELPDRDTKQPSQRWMQRQLNEALEAELGPATGVPTTPGMAGEMAIPQGGWQLDSLVGDARTQAEAQRGDPDRPPSYVVTIWRNGQREVVLGKDNLPRRFTFDPKREREEIAADQGYGRRVGNAAQQRLNAMTQPTGPM